MQTPELSYEAEVLYYSCFTIYTKLDKLGSFLTNLQKAKAIKELEELGLIDVEIRVKKKRQ